MDYADILERYAHCRAVARELNNMMSKLLSRETFGYAARQIGMWEQGKIALGDEDQIAALMDYAFSDCRDEGGTAVERYLAGHTPTPGQENVFEAMRGAYYSLFQVESAVPGVGVEVRDLFLKQRYFLADVASARRYGRGAWRRGYSALRTL